MVTRETTKIHSEHMKAFPVVREPRNHTHTVADVCGRRPH